MVQLIVDDASGNLLQVPNWERVGNKISLSLNNNIILVRAHLTVKDKLEFARSHLSILDYAYTLPLIPVKNLLKRSMVENIFFNLTSALDALSHEINQIYQLNVDFEKVQMDHRSAQTNQKNCLRCILDNHLNDRLTTYLNRELPRTIGAPNNHWYTTFLKYRNQLMHRILCLLPDDPTILDDPKYIKINGKVKFDANGSPLFSNYVHRRELRTYCMFCFNKVLEISEEIHLFLEAKI